MSETLVIEWDRDRLIAAIGSAGSRSVNVTAAITVSREQGQLLPREVGERLATALSESGILATEAIVVFPRELVTFHRVQLPNLSDHELPDMVRLQAATRLTVPVESVYLDFAPLPVLPGAEVREVLLVTVPRKHVSDVKESLSVCGLSLAGVRVSSFGIAASAVYSGLLSTTVNSNSVEAIVSLASDYIEMIFMTGHSVAFSHSGASWTSLDGVEKAVRSEISRARMSAAEDMGNYDVSRLTLIGSPAITASVPDSISKRLNDASVVRVDPEDLMKGRSPSDRVALPSGIEASDMVAVVGVIANYQATSVETVDLVNPRKSPEKKDYSRLITIAVAGAAALLLAGLWSWRSSTINKFRQQATATNATVKKLAEKYEAADNEIRLDRDLSEWTARDRNWLDEMRKIRELMGGTDRVLIRKLKFTLRSGDYIGAIDAEGYAKSRRDIEDLMQVLAEAGYEVTPKPITQSLRDPNYNMELRLEVSIPTTRSDESKKKS